MLHHLELAVVEMIFAVRDLVHYITAEKRLRVNFPHHHSFHQIKRFSRLKRNFYFWMKQNEIDDCCHRHSHRRTIKDTSYLSGFTAI